MKTCIRIFSSTSETSCSCPKQHSVANTHKNGCNSTPAGTFSVPLIESNFRGISGFKVKALI